MRDARSVADRSSAKFHDQHGYIAFRLQCRRRTRRPGNAPLRLAGSGLIPAALPIIDCVWSCGGASGVPSAPGSYQFPRHSEPARARTGAASRASARSITTIGAWRVGSAITASNGSRKARRTTAGRRPKRRSRRISQRICRTPGSGCARPPSSFGDQRIYASHNSIMFSRKACYFFVRPKRNFLEVCVFLGRPLKAPQVRRVDRTSKSKVVHVIQIRHRDEVESPITDWLQEAYELSDVLASKAGAGARSGRAKPKRGPRRKHAKGA